MIDCSESLLSYTLPITTEAPPPRPRLVLDDRDTLVFEPGGLAIRRRGRTLAKVPAPREARPSAEALELPCIFCGGTLHHATTPVRLSGAGYVVSLPRVPAWICRRCEQPYFEPPAVAEVHAAVAAARRQPVAV